MESPLDAVFAENEDRKLLQEARGYSLRTVCESQRKMVYNFLMHMAEYDEVQRIRSKLPPTEFGEADTLTAAFHYVQSMEFIRDFVSTLEDHPPTALLFMTTNRTEALGWLLQYAPRVETETGER